ncbi:MAG: hypothetical protein HOV80_13025 [Polyangiaceae bacterium]|nr:hypothetical protein [Polyangiaceae bacterium]
MTDDCKSNSVASTVDAVVEVSDSQSAEVKRRRHQREDHRGAGGRRSVIREEITDVDMAIRELETAKEEIAQVPEHLRRWERKNAMLEPMSRLQLAVRFLTDVLKRNGYKPT